MFNCLFEHCCSFTLIVIILFALTCQILVKLFNIADIMKLTSFLLLVIAITWIYQSDAAYSDKEPLVQTKYGEIRGKRETFTVTGTLKSEKRSYTSFRGIPYAKPPVGDLRFRAPLPPAPWHFPHDATKESPVCIQKNYLFARDPPVEGQEDCLYLNIYVPDKRAKNASGPLPVMVFIHWGGFFAGRSSTDYLSPEYFMEKDVILVTFNYRLGVMGFLSTLDDEAPGNFGFKDQVQALRFVNEIILSFGGDTNRITLFGQSAGAGSTSLHLISPESKGLFQQAISQSGVGINPWLYPLNFFAKNVTEAQALVVGCNKNDLVNTKKMMRCLRQVDAKKLVDSSKMFKYFFNEPLTTYGLVIEKKTMSNSRPFLTKMPKEYFKNGEFAKIPYIVGTVQDEGILRVSPFVRNPKVLAGFNTNFTSIFPQVMALAASVPIAEIPALQRNITDEYLGGREQIDADNPSSIQGFINLYTDRGFTHGLGQILRLQTDKNPQPIWMYNFAYRGQYSYGDLFAGTDSGRQDSKTFDWGVSHCDDLLYLFKSSKLFPKLGKLNEHDVRLKNQMVKMWTDFAQFGTPDPDGSLKWLPLQELDEASMSTMMSMKRGGVALEDLRFLNITGDGRIVRGKQGKEGGYKLKMERGFLVDRLKFWDEQEIFENYN